MSLNEKDIEILEFIRNAETHSLIKNKDEKGIPYLQHIFRLHLKLFGQTCEGCPNKIPAYIQKIKQFKIKEMENPEENKTQEFKLKKGVMIPISGTSESYSEHNITDEIALKILVSNPNRKSLFKTLPDDVDEQIAKGLSKKGENRKKPDSDKDKKEKDSGKANESELVKIGEHDFTFEKAKELFEKAGITSGATTAKGLSKKLKELKTPELKALEVIADEAVKSINVV